MAGWLRIAAALSCDAKARRVRGPHRSTSGGPKGSKLPESWQVATGESRGRRLSSDSIYSSKRPLAGCGQAQKTGAPPSYCRAKDRSRPRRCLAWPNGSAASLAARIGRNAKRNSTDWESEFLSGLCHRRRFSSGAWKALLDLLRSRPMLNLCSRTRSRIARHFEHVTGSGHSRSRCDNFVPLERKVRSRASPSRIVFGRARRMFDGAMRGTSNH